MAAWEVGGVGDGEVAERLAAAVIVAGAAGIVSAGAETVPEDWPASPSGASGIVGTCRSAP